MIEKSKIVKVIISGGGTGGHVYPALAIADALKKLTAMEILFVGAMGKMEMTIIPKSGYKIKGLWVSGLKNKSMLQKVLFVIKFFVSLLKSFFILTQYKPDVVVGVGGYASAPITFAASIFNIPTLIQEQNSYAGLSNKWLGKKAHKICVAFEGMEKFFSQDKLVLTGNPIRNKLKTKKENITNSYQHFGLSKEKKTVLITGGSLGAQNLNEAVFESIDTLIENDIQIIWQTGKLYFDNIKSQLETKPRQSIFLTDFLHDIEKAYDIADIVVARAGALTLAELALSKKACILIPSPNVADDHQTQNAQNLVNKNAALLVKDSDIKETLCPTLLQLISDEKKREALAQNISQLAKPDAAIHIAKEILKLAQK